MPGGPREVGWGRQQTYFLSGDNFNIPPPSTLYHYLQELVMGQTAIFTHVSPTYIIVTITTITITTIANHYHHHHYRHHHHHNRQLPQLGAQLLLHESVCKSLKNL